MSQDARAKKQAKQEGMRPPPRLNSDSSLRVVRSVGSGIAGTGSSELAVQPASLSVGPAQYSQMVPLVPAQGVQRMVPAGAFTINRYPSWPSLQVPVAHSLKTIPLSVGVGGVSGAQTVPGLLQQQQQQQQQWGGYPQALQQQQPSPVSQDKSFRAQLPLLGGGLSKTLLVTVLNVMSFFLLLLHVPLAIWCTDLLGKFSVILYVGPLAAVLSFWSLSLRPCGCAPTSELGIERLRIINGVVAVLDAVSGLAVPIALFHQQCEEAEEDADAEAEEEEGGGGGGVVSCDSAITSGRFISIAVAVVAAAHFILTVTLRVRAAALAQFSHP